MSLEEYDYIIVFTSHYRALYMYDRLRLKKIKTKLVTAPNKVNISCTQALKIKEEDKENIKIELERNNIYPTAVFKITKDGKKEDYELVE
ncbi:DUF3343 domain-containing protein [Clostridium sp. Sa3CUN1]|uniref:DUF3343 domain-containing protein n=1 Tax=Clostridium gallinarum TaxID=2762246 RepID=A0ABR8Q8A5_9CLOT|nr:DUF3343 domain-containing protein [Clostridium gallinarum]MBD7916634.1 DUF3343 domain-containing protein [Clostridium gallinarum]